tara:strand:- start:8342 stop:8515 length:174 start_codon:yes stop_codon:yes gene_type:complete
MAPILPVDWHPDSQMALLAKRASPHKFVGFIFPPQSSVEQDFLSCESDLGSEDFVLV